MNTTVELLVKDQYGRAAYHPFNEAARRFAAIAGTKTLTPEVIKHVTDLGFTVSYIRTPLEVP